MSREDEIVIKLNEPRELPGWPCPLCHGVGNFMDGSISYSITEIRYRPSTECPVCLGSGRVEVKPIPRE